MNRCRLESNESSLKFAMAQDTALFILVHLVLNEVVKISLVSLFSSNDISIQILSFFLRIVMGILHRSFELDVGYGIRDLLKLSEVSEI